MARVSTYLNFMGKTEDAFEFYRSVFGTEFDAPMMRMGDAPADPNSPPLSEDDKRMIMHVSLPITGGHRLMGSDALESRGHKLTFGNHISIMLEPETRRETEHIFHALSHGGSVDMPLQEMFWGDYFGSLTDRYGVAWMFNCSSRD